jgi:biotin operon repressor
LGVPRTTIYRYFQSFKHRDKEVQFRLLKRLLTSETASREKVAKQLGVSEQAFMEALKGSRSVAQVEKKLRLEESHQLEQFMEQTKLLYVDNWTLRMLTCFKSYTSNILVFSTFPNETAYFTI